VTLPVPVLWFGLRKHELHRNPATNRHSVHGVKKIPENRGSGDALQSHTYCSALITNADITAESSAPLLR